MKAIIQGEDIALRVILIFPRNNRHPVKVGLLNKHTRLASVLESRPDRMLTTIDSVHRAVLMAIERGTFAHLLFDNRAHWNHRVMAAILGVVLKLPPIPRALASRQLKSRYLEYVIEWFG